MISKPEYTVYSSEARGIASTLKAIVKDFSRSREIGIRIFKRDLKARYRKSLLGLFWAIFPPLLIAGLWIFLKGSRIASFQETAIPYPVFVFCGTMLWQIFTESLNTPLSIILSNQKVIVKVNLPIESLLIAGLYDVLFKTLIKVGILALILLIFQLSVGWELVLFPLGVIMLIFFGFTLGILLVPLGMLYNDVKSFVTLALPVMMYLTPVVYPIAREGAIGLIMGLNPMNALITTTRNWLTGQPQEDFLYFGILCLVTLVLFTISLVGLRKSIPIIIERIGS